MLTIECIKCKDEFFSNGEMDSVCSKCLVISSSDARIAYKESIGEYSYNPNYPDGSSLIKSKSSAVVVVAQTTQEQKRIRELEQTLFELDKKVWDRDKILAKIKDALSENEIFSLKKTSDKATQTEPIEEEYKALIEINPTTIKN